MLLSPPSAVKAELFESYHDVATRPMRVLFVASTRRLGGLELASLRLAELLMREQAGRQEILVACRPGGPMEAQCLDIGLPTAPFMLRNSGDIGAAGRLARITEAFDIDIVHAHSRRDFVAAALARAIATRSHGRDAGSRLIFHLHSMRPLGSPSALSGLFFGRHVDRIVTVSNVARDYVLRKHRRLRADQVVVVPNSIEPRFQMPRPGQRESIRRSYGISESATVIGMVGRMELKGQDKAIRALAEMRRPDVILMLVGGAETRNYAAKLAAMSRRLGVSERVIFCGSQPDVAPYLSAMDIFAHLPRDEAFGLAPAEAMATGLPVLVSNVGGCLELVRDGQTGLVVDPRYPQRIASRLCELIDWPHACARLAACGSAFVQERFTTRAQSAALTAVYDQVLSERTPRETGING
jgi:glycosyltransferase involved in cell wall biosynthesis